MKIIQRLLLLIITTFIWCIWVFGCVSPPDIIEQYTINTQQTPVTITLTVKTWDNFRWKVIDTIQSNTWKPFNTDTLQQILETNFLTGSQIQWNSQNLQLKYITWSIIDSTNSGSTSQQTFIIATYQTDHIFDASIQNNISARLEKTPFLKISNVIHPYIDTDLQQQTAISFLQNQDDKYYDIYKTSTNNVWLRTSIHEQPTNNQITLVIDNQNNLKDKQEIQKQQKQNTSSLFQVKETLEQYFNKNIWWDRLIIWLFVSIIAWMIHGLLPWHSKTIISTYMFSNTSSRKHIFTLITGVTLSHTIFIMLLASIIIWLQKGLGTITNQVNIIIQIIYIAFGLYFIITAITQLIKLHNNKKNLFNKHYCKEICDCWLESSLFKKTLFTGILAGCNPCIDALVLFIFAIQIGNITYSLLMILCFSLGLGIMLWVLSYIVSKTHIQISKRLPQMSQKIALYITLLWGIIIVTLGTVTFI